MFKYSNDVYDFLKWLCMLGLPALAVFLKTVANIWGVAILNPISDTVVALNVLLAGSLGISVAQYQSEQIESETEEDANGEN